eukprot:1744622-Pyramimonas_sp.AAC.1
MPPHHPFRHSPTPIRHTPHTLRGPIGISTEGRGEFDTGILAVLAAAYGWVLRQVIFCQLAPQRAGITGGRR